MPNPSNNPPSPSLPSLRLNKFLAERLGISRREADDLIADEKVFVDGEIAVLGTRVFENSEDRLGDEVIPFENHYIYLKMNKPVGYVCSRARQDETPTIYELLPKKYRGLKTVGRLDKNSSGVILFTNDGDFAFKMTHPKFVKTKTYIVELDRDLEPLHQQMIADFGIQLPDGVSMLGLTRLDADDSSRKTFEVVMSEGRNRQIRRTFAALGYKVVKLHRTSFGKYDLESLKTGEFTEVEV